MIFKSLFGKFSRSLSEKVNYYNVQKRAKKIVEKRINYAISKNKYCLPVSFNLVKKKKLKKEKS